MNRIKIGQLGICHEHAAGKMDTLRKMPEVFEIVGVVDDRNTKAAKFAGNDLTPYDGLSWMTEEELLAVPGLQAVVVETPNTDLVPAAIRCMRQGLAMHMDKPAGENLELFAELLEGCKERNLPFQMGYMFRGNPAMQWCREAANNGWLGEIFEVQGSMSHNYGGEAYQEYIGKFSGGIMFNLGCHLIDFVVAMLGRPEKVTPFLKSAPGCTDRIKNNCLAVLEYPHTLAFIHACSRELDGVNRRRLRICGTQGTVELYPMERFDGQPLLMKLTLLEDIPGYSAGDHTVDFAVQSDRYRNQLLELAEMIRGGMQSSYTLEHDYLVQEITLSAAGYRIQGH